MINPSQYADLILEPAFKEMRMYSLDAMYLMLRTALVESRLTHLKQLPTGPALGFMQIEPDTYTDIIRYLKRKHAIRISILEYCGYITMPVHPNALIHNLAFNAMIARVKYWMTPQPIPNYKDVQGHAEYWGVNYNASKEGLKTEDFIRISEGIEGCINHG